MEPEKAGAGAGSRAAAGERGRRRVLIVDDNPQVRHELATLLPLAGPIEVAGTAADGREALHLAETFRPEVVLMDLEMPEMDGCEATRQIKARVPACRVVALTVHDDETSRWRAGQSGVDEFLVKGASIESLVRAILGPRAWR